MKGENKMQKKDLKGRCSYCKEIIKKRKDFILKHIKECPEKEKINNDVKKLDKYSIILLEGFNNLQYWMVIKMLDSSSLKALDNFIRDIWVECCYHLSHFLYNESEVPINLKLSSFAVGDELEYEYDFGTTTHIRLKIIDKIESEKDKMITVLFRNIEPEYKCVECGKIANMICRNCFEFLCDECMDKHECVEENGEDIVVPLVNSPRTGECGYTGYDERLVKKYFPKEII